MTKSIGHTQSITAVEDYLDQLLCVDEETEEPATKVSNIQRRIENYNRKREENQQKSKDKKHTLLESNKVQLLEETNQKLLVINRHPKRKQQTEEIEQRHQMERVERLLDDFNYRQQKSEECEELKSNILTEETGQRVLITDSVLQQPDVISTEESEEHEDESIQAKIFIPDDLEFQREQWSYDAFQTLLFNVGKLNLALPLLKLGGIHRIENEITSLFGKPDWFLGITPGLTGNINVIDTAKWVMPNNSTATEIELDYQFVILLGESNWGLACTDVQTASNLSPEDVKWREKTGKRPWLAGMMLERMCALLDVDTMIQLLDENFPR